jgi:hypothetical protein
MDGLHTGGAWFYKNKVWKPLDGRPYANAPIHVETEEEACLTALKGNLLFPKNWEIKQENGRRFVVRDKVQTFPGGSLRLSLSDLNSIRTGIADMNKAGWAVNDEIVIGRDRSGSLFLLDLSNASYTQTKSGPYKADDSNYVDQLFEQAGFEEEVQLRKLAKEMRGLMIFKPDFAKLRDHRWFYSAKRKVTSKELMDLSSAIELLTPTDQTIAKKHFWYISKQQLPQSTVRLHGLTLRAEG